MYYSFVLSWAITILYNILFMEIVLKYASQEHFILLLKKLNNNL